MYLIKKLFIISLLLLQYPLLASSISGKINMDENWEPVIYLSLINSFDDLNAASFDFLVAETSIDSTGNFEFDGLELPKTDRLYRLHICKKGDPVSTIIIGGRDENFAHFIMNGQSEIKMIAPKSNNVFQDVHFNGHPANKGLAVLLSLQKELQTPPSIPSKQSRELRKQNILNQYVAIADTSSFLITKLFALHLLTETTETPKIEVLQRVNNNLKVTDSSNPYFKTFSEQLDYMEYQSQQTGSDDLWWLKWTGLIMFIVLIPLAYRMRTRKLRARTKKISSAQQLSVQEKKVFDLLKAGSSNKEISDALNIEVSTVKSHVHKIFSRLGVKSRKEIVNGDW